MSGGIPAVVSEDCGWQVRIIVENVRRHFVHASIVFDQILRRTLQVKNNIFQLDLLFAGLGGFHDEFSTAGFAALLLTIIIGGFLDDLDLDSGSSRSFCLSSHNE
jgi:hypothetical protein